MSAESYTEMSTAAGELRTMALDTGVMLMDPQLGTELGLQASVLDAERRRLEIADLAIDVVTAADYLLNLIRDPSAADRPGYSAVHDQQDHQSKRRSDDQDWEDIRLRCALDAGRRWSVSAGDCSTSCAAIQLHLARRNRSEGSQK